MKKLILLQILFLTIAHTAISQNDNSIFHNRVYSNSPSKNNLYFEIQGINFFKNNEYFSNFADGYTNIGFHLSHTLSYNICDRGKISAGFHVLQYSGRDEFEDILPIFSFHYNIKPNFKLIFGSLQSTTNHNLIDPLFDFEQVINDNTENGIQFLYQSKKIDFDLWLDWKQFIKRGDPFQEKFTLGFSSEIMLCQSDDKNWELTLPLQFTFNHYGGQIDTSDKNIVTLFDNATGLFIERKINNSFIRTIKGGFYYLLYQDFSPTKGQAYENGDAYYPFLSFASEKAEITTGYWHSHKFYSPLGHPLFQNISVYDNEIHTDVNKMVTMSFTYQQKVLKNIKLATRFEGFYNINESRLDYTYSLYLLFNSRFFLYGKDSQ